MNTNGDPVGWAENPRAVAMFKVLLVFSRERQRVSGVDELDHCHWSDVARMMRKATDGNGDAVDQARNALTSAIEQGISPFRLAAAVSKLAQAIALEAELTVAAMTMQAMQEVSRRRRLPSGRRWAKRA